MFFSLRLYPLLCKRTDAGKKIIKKLYSEPDDVAVVRLTFFNLKKSMMCFHITVSIGIRFIRFSGLNNMVYSSIYTIDGVILYLIGRLR
jgi:hypothetical protein